MARIKEVLELIKRRYTQVKGVAPRATKKVTPAVAREGARKTDRTRGTEIIRAVFPNKP
jgi:hypothetical protein